MPPHRDKTFLDILLDNNAMKTHRHGQWLIMLIYIKSVGVYSCHSFHAERPSHCPILLNEQRQKPTPICIRKNHLYPKGYKVTMHNTHPWTSTVASFLTEFGKLRSFSASRTSVSKRFPINVPHPWGFCQNISLLGRMPQRYDNFMNIKEVNSKKWESHYNIFFLVRMWLCELSRHLIGIGYKR